MTLLRESVVQAGRRTVVGPENAFCPLLEDDDTSTGLSPSTGPVTADEFGTWRSLWSTRSAHRAVAGRDVHRTFRAVAMCRARHKWHVHGLPERARWRYWTIRAWVEGWVLLLVRRGPRAFWRRLTHAPCRSALRFGFSTVAHGYRPEPDVAVVLTPPGPVEPGPSIISPRRVRDFVRTVVGAPSEPRLDALVALEEEHGPTA